MVLDGIGRKVFISIIKANIGIQSQQYSSIKILEGQFEHNKLIFGRIIYADGEETISWWEESGQKLTDFEDDSLTYKTERMI